jgi:vacuolar-type H+-ATPase subunit H
VEDKVLEEMQIHQSALKRDPNSPLFLIREKEMEISGRMLAARQEAERTVAEGRRKVAEIIGKAETEAEALAREHEVTRVADAEREAESIRAKLPDEAAPIEAHAVERHDAAVAAVVEMVTRV